MDDHQNKSRKSKRSQNFSQLLDKTPVFLDDINQNGERVSPANT